MSIYFGNNKIGKIYVGGTSIGKVYKGSELVYQKITGAQLYLTSEPTTDKNGTMLSGLLGGWNTSAWVVVCASSPYKIISISGTLGASGSKITTSDTSLCPYVKTYTINGKTYYAYVSTGGYVDICVMAEKGSVAGNYCMEWLGNSGNSNNPLIHPSSVTANSYTATIYPGSWAESTSTTTRATSRVLTFNKNSGWIGL